MSGKNNHDEHDPVDGKDEHGGNDSGGTPVVPAFTPLDLYAATEQEQEFRAWLDETMVEQVPAKVMAGKIYRAFLNPVRNRSKPVYILVSLGPTGVGKTLLPQLLAERFHGRRDAMIKVDCAEYKYHSDFTRLFGAGPSWIGYSKPDTKLPPDQMDSSALLSAHNITACRYGSKSKITFILLDEWEKACPDFQQIFLSIFDSGKCKMANNTESDFTECVFVLTSNLGMAEAEQQARRQIGLGHPDGNEGTTHSTESIVERLWLQRFSPEFRNRVDGKVIYHNLSPSGIRKVVDVEVRQISKQLSNQLKANMFELNVDTSAGDWIATQAVSGEGARSIKRLLTTHVSDTIGTGLISKQLAPGHRLTIRHQPGANRLSFERSGEGRPLVETVEDLPEKVREADALYDQANRHFGDGQYNLSIEAASMTLARLEEDKNSQPYRRASAMNLIGLNHFKRSNYSDAAVFFEAALVIRLPITTLENIGTTPRPIMLYKNLADAHVSMGDGQEAERWFAEGVEAVELWPSTHESALRAVNDLFNAYKQFNPAKTTELDQLLKKLKGE